MSFKKYLNERMDDKEQKIDEIFLNADDSFWSTVAHYVPEATGGDFPPDAMMAWEEAAKEAIRTWMMYNVPGEEE